MATNFPTSKDSYTHPNPNDPRSGATSLSTQFSNIQDAVSALETKVGITASADTTSQDYKLSGVTGSDKAASLIGAETLTNKTLTAPKINVGSDATGDIYYRASDGTLTRLPAGTAGQILDINASTGLPEWIPNPSAADATYTVKGVDYKKANAEYYAADAGSTDAYAITLSPAPTAYVAGQEFSFKANTVNTGAATLNVNTLGAKTIVKGVNTTLADGDIAAGQVCTVIYDGANFVLQNQVANPYTNLSYVINADENISNYTTNQINLEDLSVTNCTMFYQGTGFKSNSLNGAVRYCVLGDSQLFSQTKIYKHKAPVSVNMGSSERFAFGISEVSSGAAFNETDTTKRKIGFVIGPSNTVWSVTCDGSAKTATVISGVTALNMNLYSYTWTPGTDVKFYVNGVLKATHTTNIPNDGTLAYLYGVAGTMFTSSFFIGNQTISVQI